MMPWGRARASRWLLRAAALCFLASFLLPAARLGGRENRAAPGALVAPLSAYVLPLGLQATSRSGLATRAFAVAVGLYFLVLVLQNAVMLYALHAARGGAPRPLVRAQRLALAAAVLPWGVPLVDFERLYGVLGLADGRAVELREGYLLWTGSFLLLALGLRLCSRETLPAARAAEPAPAAPGH